MWDVRFYKGGLVGLSLLFIFTFIFFFFLHLNCGSMEIMEKKCWEVPKKHLKKSVTVFTVFEYLSNLPEWGLAGSYCKMIMLQMSFNVFLQMQIKTYECICISIYRLPPFQLSPRTIYVLAWSWLEEASRRTKDLTNKNRRSIAW